MYGTPAVAQAETRVQEIQPSFLSHGGLGGGGVEVKPHYNLMPERNKAFLFFFRFYFFLFSVCVCLLVCLYNHICAVPEEA